MLKKRNILIAVTTIAVVLTTGAAAFAATDTDASQPAMSKLSGTEGRLSVMADLSDEQREAVRQANIDSTKEAVAELVENGVITQEEADKLLEINSVLRDNTEENDGQKALTDEKKEALTQEIASVWEKAAADLVEEGILTQEEADAITLVPKFKADGKGFFGTLTEEQRTELAEAIKAKFESCLAGLVDDGTITQEQADQLLKVGDGMHMWPGGRPGFGGHSDFNGKSGSGEQSDEEQDTTL